MLGRLIWISLSIFNLGSIGFAQEHKDIKVYFAKKIESSRFKLGSKNIAFQRLSSEELQNLNANDHSVKLKTQFMSELLDNSNVRKKLDTIQSLRNKNFKAHNVVLIMREKKSEDPKRQYETITVKNKYGYPVKKDLFKGCKSVRTYDLTLAYLYDNEKIEDLKLDTESENKLITSNRTYKLQTVEPILAYEDKNEKCIEGKFYEQNTFGKFDINTIDKALGETLKDLNTKIAENNKRNTGKAKASLYSN